MICSTASAAAAKSADPADERAKWVLAESIILKERAGLGTGPESWVQAAELLQQVYAKKQDDALPLVYAISFLLEGAELAEALAGAFQPGPVGTGIDLGQRGSGDAGIGAGGAPGPIVFDDQAGEASQVVGGFGVVAGQDGVEVGISQDLGGVDLVWL